MKILLPIFTVLVLFLGCDKADSAAGVPGGTGTGGSMARFTIAGDYLYTVDKQNLKVYNIARPQDPAYVRTVPVGFEIETIYPFKDRLFIGSTSVVHIFSLADPSAPQKLSVAISPEVLTRCDPVVAKENVAYATLRATGPCGGVASILAVYDITDVLRPRQVTTRGVSEPYGLGYADSALYVCDNRDGLIVYNISNPYNPQWVRSLPATAPRDVIPYGNTLVVWTSRGVQLYDISTRLRPQLITEIN